MTVEIIMVMILMTWIAKAMIIFLAMEMKGMV
jgi:hypothetical protein